MNWFIREWRAAGGLGRAAIVASCVLLVISLVLAAAFGAAVHDLSWFYNYGNGDGGADLPLAAPGTPAPTRTSSMPELRGGITRYPLTATPAP